MKRTNIIQLMPSKQQKKMLKEMMLLSSCVYNMGNYITRQSFFDNKKSPTFMDLQQKLQKKDDYQLLGRSYALPRLQIYGETNSARFKLIKSKSQKHVGLPKYYKNRKTNTTIPSYLVIDGSQYLIKKHHIHIPLSRQMRKKYKIGKSFKIKYNGILKHKGTQKRGQIHYKDGHFYMYQSVDMGEIIKKKIINSCGVDLGIKRLISYKTTNNISSITGSKRYFKQFQHYNSLIANEQYFLSTLNRKISNKLKRIYSKRSKYQKQLFDNIIKAFFKKMVKNNIQQLYVGDVKGIRNTKSKSKILNNMINNYWSYNIFYSKMENKAEELGITLHKITEEYTSITCPECGFISKNNVKDREFICKKCIYKNDRDIVGATNILTKGMYSHLENIHRGEVAPLEVSI